MHTLYTEYQVPGAGIYPRTGTWHRHRTINRRYWYLIPGNCYPVQGKSTGSIGLGWSCSFVILVIFNIALWCHASTLLLLLVYNGARFGDHTTTHTQIIRGKQSAELYSFVQFSGVLSRAMHCILLPAPFRTAIKSSHRYTGCGAEESHKVHSLPHCAKMKKGIRMILSYTHILAKEKRGKPLSLFPLR